MLGTDARGHRGGGIIEAHNFLVSFIVNEGIAEEDDDGDETARVLADESIEPLVALVQAEESLRIGTAPRYQVRREKDVQELTPKEVEQRQEAVQHVAAGPLVVEDVPRKPIRIHRISEAELMQFLRSGLLSEVFGFVGAAGVGGAISAWVGIASNPNTAGGGDLKVVVGVCITSAVLGGGAWVATTWQAFANVNLSTEPRPPIQGDRTDNQSEKSLWRRFLLG